MMIIVPNETLEPGFPQKIAVETARKWMHVLGFEVVTKKKGTFVDGHEHEDVMEYHKTFLWRMVSLGFLNASNAPTDKAKKALPAEPTLIHLNQKWWKDRHPVS